MSHGGGGSEKCRKSVTYYLNGSIGVSREGLACRDEPWTFYKLLVYVTEICKLVYIGASQLFFNWNNFEVLSRIKSFLDF